MSTTKLGMWLRRHTRAGTRVWVYYGATVFRYRAPKDFIVRASTSPTSSRLLPELATCLRLYQRRFS